MTSESGGALSKLGDVPHPGMLGLGVRLQLSVKLHILPETKMSWGSALLLRASLLQSFLHPPASISASRRSQRTCVNQAASFAPGLEQAVPSPSPSPQMALEAPA